MSFVISKHPTLAAPADPTRPLPLADKALEALIAFVGCCRYTWGPGSAGTGLRTSFFVTSYMPAVCQGPLHVAMRLGEVWLCACHVHDCTGVIPLALRKQDGSSNSSIAHVPDCPSFHA